MKTKAISRVLAITLCLVMLLSVAPLTAFGYNAAYQSETHTVFRHLTQTLAPGVEYYNNYAYLNDGEQVVYYVAVADINRDDVIVQGSYWNAQTEQYGMAKLTEQVASANAKFTNPNDADFISENYAVVAGTNGDFYNMQTGRPSGAFAINGHIMNDANNRPWFAVFEDGVALCGSGDADYNAAKAAHGAVMNSVGGSQLLVNNGVDVTASASGSYNTDRHSRTMIGVTADNKVVCAVVDGRQSPFSDGGSMHELAQIMIEAECVTAINLDGGGSTTFGARPEGEDSFRVINRPSDGSERSISSGVVIASLAAPSNVFDHAAITVEDEYVTPYAEVNFSAVGVSTSGASAEIPGEVSYSASLGQVVDGKFVSDGTVGDAEIRAEYNGEVVGTATVHVVIPDTVEFAQETFTVPYGKTVDLPFVAKYGLNDVVVKPADFTYTLATPTGAGEVVNGAFVGPDEASGATGNTVTATLVYDNTKTTTASIVFGKASVVLWDFEDGTTQKWVRYNTSNYNYILTRGTTSNVTAENGQVHSGEHALKVTALFSETWEAGYVSGRLGVNGMDEIIDLKGATRLGMWVYLPIELKSFNGRIFMCKVTERDEETGEITKYEGYYTQTKIDQGGDWNCGFITQYEEPGWHYIYFDLSTDTDWCIIKNHCLLDFYINDRNGDSYGYNHLDYTSQNSDLIMYVDDVTVDYSSVVEDRDAPVFSSVLLGDRGDHSNDAMVLTDGYVSNGFSQISLSARVADYAAANATGLNGASAKCFIDGNEVPCTFNTGLISADEYDFADGQHTVKFSICDNQGNLKSTYRTFTVNANTNRPTIKIVPHDATLDRILLGSLYYVDVVATDATNVAHVSVSLDLNNLSVWELEHMEPADGVQVTWTIDNEDEKIARIEITKTAECELTGEATLVSIPIRTWELPAVAADYGHAGVVWMYPQYRSGNEVWPVDISVSVAKGFVSFSDGSNDYFTGDKVQVDTESIYWDNDNAKASDPYYTSWNGGHDHRPETAQYYAEGNTNHVDPTVTKEAKAPSCTEAGWTAELYCPVCNSIVQWSEEIPMLPHSYEMSPKTLKFIISDNGANKSPDLTFEGGVGYYYENGEYKSFETDAATNVLTFTNSGNFANPTVYVWFEGEDGANAWPGVAMTYAGQNEFNQAQYTFEMPESPVVLHCTNCGELFNGLFEDGKYYFDGVMAEGWIEDSYYVDGVMLTGIQELDGFYYDFGEDGVCTGHNKYTGLLELDGAWYYSKLGVLTGGWAEIDGNWHYFDPDTLAAVSGTVKLNGVTYEFNEQGMTPGAWLTDSKGSRFFYSSACYRAGGQSTILFAEIDGNTYGFDQSGYRYEGRCYVVESNKQYKIADFTDEGVFIGYYNEPGQTVVECVNGLIYAVDGIPTHAGLVKLGDDYYYAGTGGKLAVSVTRYINADWCNGLVEPGNYEFGPDGKMIYETEDPKNGIVEVDGVLYYFEDDVATHKGLMLIDGNYYYAGTGGKLAVSVTRYINADWVNGLMEPGTYEFDAEGKMVNVPQEPEIPENGIVEVNGVLYYYEDGVPCHKGLVEIDGDIYYAGTNGKLAVNVTRYVNADWVNGLMAPGTYEFGPDGKMVQPEVEKNGIVDVNGVLYYYVNGVATHAGLVEIDGDIYYAGTGGKVAVNVTRYVNRDWVNGILEPGTYTFGPDGKLVQD